MNFQINASIIKMSLVLVGLCFGAMDVSAQTVPAYFVTSRDPHVLKKLAPYVSQKYEKGRQLAVRLKVPFSALSKTLQKNLKLMVQGDPQTMMTQFMAQPSRSAPDPRVVEVLKQVDLNRMRESVRKLISVKDRSAGSPENQAITQWLHGSLASMGYEAQYHCFATKQCNVLAKKVGTVKPQESVIVVAHFDSVGHPYAGADDNASGTAGLLEIARVLADKMPGLTIRFFATNAEENGLVGSSEFVKVLTPDQLKDIKLVVNMDMIAWNKDGIVDLETNAPFIPVAQWFAQKVADYTTLKANIVTPAWGSDHVPFLRKNVPTVLTIEHWETHTPCWHGTCDKEEGLNFEYAAEIIKLNVAAVLERAEVPL